MEPVIACDLTEPVQIRHPGGKDGMWTARCACGQYSTGACDTPERATEQLTRHVEDKRANLRICPHCHKMIRPTIDGFLRHHRGRKKRMCDGTGMAVDLTQEVR